MFCQKCGTKIEKGVKFCQNCGIKIEDKPTMDSLKITSPVVDSRFYSEDWQRTWVITFASLPYLDVMADKDNLYLIALPKYYGATVGFLIGLLFKLVGALIGYYIGASRDKKKRQKYRTTWLSLDQKIISKDYEKNIFLKISLNSIKGNIVLKKNKFILTNGDQKITLRKNKKEGERFNKFIEKYVL